MHMPLQTPSRPFCRNQNTEVGLHTEDSHYRMPLPLPPLPPLPPTPGAPGFSFSDAGLRTVSSTLRIRQAASVAAVIAFLLTSAGSQINLSQVLQMPSFSMSMPAFASPLACACRSLLSSSV